MERLDLIFRHTDWVLRRGGNQSIDDIEYVLPADILVGRMKEERVPITDPRVFPIFNTPIDFGKNLILYMPKGDAHGENRLEYPSRMTPLEVMGAIYTYYRNTPVSGEIRDLDYERRIPGVQPNLYDYLGDHIHFEGLYPHTNGDGDYDNDGYRISFGS